MLRRSALREIRQSLGRYLAILSIVALGVGFFAGLKVTRSCMVKTAADYVSQQSLYDFKLVSTLGYDDDSARRVAAADGVKNVEVSKTLDVLITDRSGSERVFKAITLNRHLNRPLLQKGRMPRSGSECVVDSHCSGIAVGDVIRLAADNEKSTKKRLRRRSYRVVGTIASPLYLDYNRGSTSLGDGTVSGFFALLPSGFRGSTGSELYVSVETGSAAFSNAYDRDIRNQKRGIRKAAKAASAARRQKLVRSARSRLNKQKARYRRSRAACEKEKQQSEEKLEAAAARLDQAEAQLAEQKADLMRRQTRLQNARRQLDTGIQRLDSSIDRIKKALAQASAGAGAGGAQDIAAPGGSGSGTGTGDPGSGTGTGGSGSGTGTGDPGSGTGTGDPGSGTGTGDPGSGTGTGGDSENGAAQLNTLKQQLQRKRRQLQRQRAQVDSGLSRISDGLRELRSGSEELAAQRQSWQSGKAEAEAEFAAAEKKLDRAAARLDKAERSIDDISAGRTYVLTRAANPGYATYESNTSILSSVARVFPLFFFLVAALVCMTTMTRMIDEQRAQIGVLKALGFGNRAILGKYLFYAGSAGGIGALSGYFLGTWLFPAAIWKAYGSMYDFSDRIAYVFSPRLFLLSLGAALLCTVGTAWICCAGELRSAPAALLRPKAPHAGRRILLERIRPLWNHISFLWKVSLRNIFRYKKRFLMMIVGISGCTALLVAGFGIRTTIAGIGDYQYNEIDKYDYTVTFSGDSSAARQQAFRRSVQSGSAGAQVRFLNQESVEFSNAGKTRTVTLVTDRAAGFSDFVDLHSEERAVAFPRRGTAVLCQRLQEHYGVRVGDTVTLTQGSRRMRVKVSGFCDNYINDYIYISRETYADGFGREPRLKTAWVRLPDASAAAVRASAAKARKCDRVTAVSTNRDMLDRIDEMMSSLTAVVLLIILCAGALAFIVLYNLTGIHITERIREIATIKVLGFYPGETASYVFRENFLLTAVGALVGLPLGTWLLHFVVHQINVATVYFEVRISPSGYLLSFVVTFVFALLVALVMSRRLRRISMTESLKSIE
jgi:putative ABC transport system permease protein